jgi:hypothetical protein
VKGSRKRECRILKKKKGNTRKRSIMKPGVWGGRGGEVEEDEERKERWKSRRIKERERRRKKEEK